MRRTESFSLFPYCQLLLLAGRLPPHCLSSLLLNPEGLEESMTDANKYSQLSNKQISLSKQTRRCVNKSKFEYLIEKWRSTAVAEIFYSILGYSRILIALISWDNLQHRQLKTEYALNVEISLQQQHWVKSLSEANKYSQMSNNRPAGVSTKAILNCCYRNFLFHTRLL